MRTTIGVEIDCGKILCEKCNLWKYLGYNEFYCMPFRTALKTKKAIKNKLPVRLPVRLPICLAGGVKEVENV